MNRPRRSAAGGPSVRPRTLAAGALAVALALSAGACSLAGPPGLSPMDSAYEPLEAWVAAPHEVGSSPFGLFWLSRPAYVAVFDIRPGVGVSAVYPWSDATEQRRFHAGYNSLLPVRNPLRLAFSSGGFPFVTSYPGFGYRGSSFGTGFRSNGFAGCSGLASPVVYRLIVASEEPLRLSELRGRVEFAFRPAFRSLHFSIGSPTGIMQELSRTIVPGYREAVGGALLSETFGTPEWTGYYTAFWSPVACDLGRVAHLSRFFPFDARDGGQTPPADEGRPADGEQGDEGDEADDRTGGGVPDEPIGRDPRDEAFRLGDPTLEPEAADDRRGAPEDRWSEETALGEPVPDSRVLPVERGMELEPLDPGEELRKRVRSGELRGRLGPAPEGEPGAPDRSLRGDGGVTPGGDDAFGGSPRGGDVFRGERPSRIRVTPIPDGARVRPGRDSGLRGRDSGIRGGHSDIRGRDSGTRRPGPRLRGRTGSAPDARSRSPSSFRGWGSPFGRSGARRPMPRASDRSPTIRRGPTRTFRSNPVRIERTRPRLRSSSSDRKPKKN